MDYKNIFADQSTIQINVMKIDGKRLTKSLIDQMPHTFPFDKQYNFIGEKIFGYAKTGKLNSSEPRVRNLYTIIAQIDGKLVSFNEWRLYDIVNIKPTTPIRDFSIRALKEILGDQPEYFVEKAPRTFLREMTEEYTIENSLTEEGKVKLFAIVEKVKSLYDEIFNHQIYI